MIKSDVWIREQGVNLIEPFTTEQVRELEYGNKVVSYGRGAYGYDLRLSDKDFRLFAESRLLTIIDPKRFDANCLVPTKPSASGYYVIPGNGQALGVIKEYITMPDNVMAYAWGKSTYARCGIVPFIQPIENGWEGHLSILIVNFNPNPVKVYANEGICQICFFEGEKAEMVYNAERKYQGQVEVVTLARV